MKKILKKINDIILRIEYLILIIIIILNVIPYCFGMQPNVVLSGSMEPVIQTGAMAYVNKNVDVSQIKTGDIIAFHVNDTQITHRVIEKNDDTKTFVTKGDANKTNDFAPVGYNQFVGKTEFSIPYFGYLMTYIHSFKGMFFLAILLISQNLLSYLLDNDDQKKQKENEGDYENEYKKNK